MPELKPGLNVFHLYGNLLERCVSRHQALPKSICTLFLAYFGLIFALLAHFPHRPLILICILLRIPPPVYVSAGEVKERHHYPSFYPFYPFTTALLVGRLKFAKWSLQDRRRRGSSDLLFWWFKRPPSCKYEEKTAAFCEKSAVWDKLSVKVISDRFHDEKTSSLFPPCAGAIFQGLAWGWGGWTWLFGELSRNIQLFAQASSASSLTDPADRVRP